MLNLATHNVWLNLYVEGRNNDVPVGVGASPLNTTTYRITRYITTCDGIFSFVPRPSHCPVFDDLQHAKTEGEGRVHFIT